jgi:hypothetical protein
MSEYKGFNRFLFDKLIDWKSSPYRKPLILRGFVISIILKHYLTFTLDPI